MRKGFVTLACGLSLVGCASDSSQSYIAGFSPPPVPAGYERFVTPVVENIQPGDNVEYCQWIAAPQDTRRDVLAFTGAQSKTGHHTVLFATTETNFAVGESHECTTDDMISVSFIGGVGGEGAGESSNALPDGVYFSVPPGQALMANTHWLNATDSPVEGQAVIDVKFADPDPSRTIADLFINNGDQFELPPATPTSYDVSCTLQQDLSFALLGNHMHTYGTSVYSELVHPDGTKDMLVQDAVWNPENQFNPQVVKYEIATPKVAHAGDVYHTHCEWTNTTSKTMLFPDEMCGGFGFYFPSNGQLVCDDGGWGR